jgi:ABC-type sugar transport system permease subunit
VEELFGMRLFKPIVRAVTIVRENYLAYSLVTPIILFLIILLWYPFLKGIWISFHRWIFLGKHEWIGLQNYRWFLGSDLFKTSLIATLIYSSGTLGQLALALIAGVALSQRFVKYKSVLAMAFVLPFAMPPVVSGAIWTFILDPDLGIVMHYFKSLGFKAIYWQSSPWTAKGIVTLNLIWTFWPFMFIIIYAALQSIPVSQYEAAQVFGAGYWRTILRVIIPQIKLPILAAVILRIIWNLVKVSQVIQLTNGGPGFETSILSVAMYRYAYGFYHFGEAYAIGMILLLLILILILPVVSRIRRVFE